MTTTTRAARVAEIHGRSTSRAGAPVSRNSLRPS